VRSSGGSPLASSAPRAAAAEKAMAPVLVLPCAIGLGEHCRGVLFETAGGIRRGPWADLIGRATITKATIAFTGTRGAGCTDWRAAGLLSRRSRRRPAGHRHRRRAIRPRQAGAAPGGAADRARCAVRGAFLASFASATGDLLFDLVSLDEMFLAFGYQPSFGPLAVAYAAPDIASAIPITPGGLG